MAHYVHDEKNNLIDALSKEEIYALLADVIEQGELPIAQNEAFVTMFKNIVDGNPYKIAFCTQAEYNELEQAGEIEENALYYITDDTTLDDLEAYLDNLAAADASLQTALENAVTTLNTAIENLGNELRPYILYSGSSTPVGEGDQITLNDSLANYKYLEIYYHIYETYSGAGSTYGSNKVKCDTLSLNIQLGGSFAYDSILCSYGTSASKTANNELQIETDCYFATLNSDGTVSRHTVSFYIDQIVAYKPTEITPQ